MKLLETLNIPVLGDDRGQLYVFEGDICFPAGLKRVYYLTGTKKSVSRGYHAHRELEQIAVCVSGSCKMVMDDGAHRDHILLDGPGKAIRIPKMVWHEMHDFSEDCVLLVMASDVYDEADYIRSYSDFKGLIAND